MTNFIPNIQVIFRACDSVTSLHGTDRPFGLSKENLIRLCFYSLVKSIEHYPHHIHVLGDNLSQEMKTFFNAFKVTLHDRSRLGNDESIRQSFHLAKALPEKDWVYFCEDDYLHVPHSFQWVRDFFAEKEQCLSYQPKAKWPYLATGNLSKKDLYLHLTDYPDRYDGDRKKASFIFHTSSGHWRQVSNTTFSFITSIKTVKKKWSYFLRSAHKADDYYLSQKLYGQRFFWGRGLCLSPIPSLTAHMHKGTMSPVIDWKKILDDWKKQFESKVHKLAE